MSDSKEWKWDNFCLQAEKASLVHFLDFLSLIFLTMIWAICPRDSLAVVGQWIQSKLQEVRLTFSVVLPGFLGMIILFFAKLNRKFGEKGKRRNVTKINLLVYYGMCSHKSDSALVDADFHLSCWRTLGFPKWLDLIAQAAGACLPIKTNDCLLER